ncbi:hypothetical protein sscle_01g010560 [Sclerotinia sclerotiorum 1980 UF-70]|uniref:Uncharacterized protein n=1 Tax=Sclerotinia sclerotiorum (strain ATCC 18683 / 1980 / Ss-1) TaxID=665079 RepID=A0A1D9PUE7_SCLS1|nr:hypothetical protein sscle_01g010560 [Sclerotinia sclerotiorum 1980 UF-70]
MLDFHIGTPFDLAFKAHLKENCKFVVDLCTKKPNCQHFELLPVPVPNLELQLVLVDRVLETKDKDGESKKRKLSHSGVKVQ